MLLHLHVPFDTAWVSTGVPSREVELAEVLTEVLLQDLVEGVAWLLTLRPTDVPVHGCTVNPEVAGRSGHGVPTVVPCQVLRLAVCLDLLIRTTLVLEVLVLFRHFRSTEDFSEVVALVLQSTDHYRHVEVHVPEGHEVRHPVMALVNTFLDHGPRGLHDLDLELNAPWLDQVTQVRVQRIPDLVDCIRDAFNPRVKDGHDGLVLERHRRDDDVLTVAVPHVGLGVEYGHLVGMEQTGPLLLVLTLQQSGWSNVCPVDVLVTA
ncbi:hypothetical protein D3C84_452800 [compost metagenome]